jgi:hypothetical protein
VRGWLLVRVVIASCVAVAGWLLGIIPVLPPDWQPRAPLVALAIVFLLYLAAEYMHGIAGRKETPAYRAHVGNLQDFARHSRQTVEKESPGLTYTVTDPINVSQPLGRAFKKHFRNIATRIDDWNLVATGYQETFGELQRAVNAEADRLGVATPMFGSALPNLLYVIAIGSDDPNEIVWFVENGRINAQQSRGTFSVALLPTTEAETEQLLVQLSESCLLVRDLPEVVEWRRRTRVSEELWPSLRDELASVEVMHDPPGRCPLCPK